MEIDLQTINSNSLPPVKRRADTSIQKNDSSKVKARTEEAVKLHQKTKESAIKQLEVEMQNVAEQAERIDAEKYLREIIDITEVFNRKLKFSIDKDLGQVIVKVVDINTDKVIKEIPPDQLKRLYAKMKEAMGLIIDTTI
ncbi:MAG: flagellar protein FlaG [Spirochaetales bacterium]|nr:flagellar protein FlaG [Spirochaetales bacterium]